MYWPTHTAETFCPRSFVFHRGLDFQSSHLFFKHFCGSDLLFSAWQLHFSEWWRDFPLGEERGCRLTVTLPCRAHNCSEGTTAYIFNRFASFHFIVELDLVLDSLDLPGAGLIFQPDFDHCLPQLYWDIPGQAYLHVALRWASTRSRWFIWSLGCWNHCLATLPSLTPVRHLLDIGILRVLFSTPSFHKVQLCPSLFFKVP